MYVYSSRSLDASERRDAATPDDVTLSQVAMRQSIFRRFKLTLGVINASADGASEKGVWYTGKQHMTSSLVVMSTGDSSYAWAPAGGGARGHLPCGI